MILSAGHNFWRVLILMFFYATNNSNELQVAQGYNLRDRTTIASPDRYRYPRSAAVIVEPTTYQKAAGIHE